MLSRLALALASLLSLAACDDPCLPPMMDVPDMPNWPTEEPTIPAGQPMGPCEHDGTNTFWFCDASAPVICAIPQEQGQPHATVCVERRAVGDCGPVAIDGIVYGTVQDNFPHACVIACVDSSECPTAMGCAAGICAYPTFN
jgi:hypothetical protein